jgi:hypothetical protein
MRRSFRDFSFDTTNSFPRSARSAWERPPRRSASRALHSDRTGRWSVRPTFPRRAWERWLFRFGAALDRSRLTRSLLFSMGKRATLSQSIVVGWSRYNVFGGLTVQLLQTLPFGRCRFSCRARVRGECLGSERNLGGVRRASSTKISIMDQVDNERATAQELVSFAQTQGFDLNQFRKDCVFQKDRRWVFLWRKNGIPCSGPVNEPDGTLHYNMQGAISALPNKLKGSASAFRGEWSEAGTFENIEQAVELVKAWLLDGKEVDDLPQREVRRYQI